MSTDRLADVISNPRNLGGYASPTGAAARVREAFVVIDRDDLPGVVPDTDKETGSRATVTYDAAGHVAEAYIPPPTQGFASATPEWHEAKAKVHLAAAEYLEAHPPEDEKAVEELTATLRDAIPDVYGSVRKGLARRLIADGWTKP